MGGMLTSRIWTRENEDGSWQVSDFTVDTVVLTVSAFAVQLESPL
jgi:hypothetical protein